MNIAGHVPLRKLFSHDLLFFFFFLMNWCEFRRFYLEPRNRLVRTTTTHNYCNNETVFSIRSCIRRHRSISSFFLVSRKGEKRKQLLRRSLTLRFYEVPPCFNPDLSQAPSSQFAVGAKQQKRRCAKITASGLRASSRTRPWPDPGGKKWWGGERRRRGANNTTFLEYNPFLVDLR